MEIVGNFVDETLPTTIEEKINFLNKYHIALWDSIAECEIVGSSDASIRNIKTNDIKKILENSKVKIIICNGKTSYKIYEKYIYPQSKIHAISLPSTSPANAVYSLEELVKAWSVLKNRID